jgi:GntR family transcriptional regulator/MocR family aminotransferase
MSKVVCSQVPFLRILVEPFWRLYAMVKQANAFPLALISLERAAVTPLYRQIYDSLSAAILNGQLAPGWRLPSTRELAEALNVSRNTVMNAFDQLLAEGYLMAGVGSGTYVTHTLPDELLRLPVKREHAPPSRPAFRYLSQRGTLLAQTRASLSRGAGLDHVFSHGLPAIDAFPFDLWARLVSRRYRESPTSLFQYGAPAGYQPLRDAISTYLKAARAVQCEPEQVIICAGSQQALDLTTRLLLDPGDVAWIEDPGYLGARAALTGAGAIVLPVPVGPEGIDMNAAPHRQARLIYVTPSHQFPLGVTMSLTHRLNLLHRTTGWIIEDDYDSEFRYAGRPVPALQGLDTEGRVIYLGTFSKVLFPALRVGYLVVPPDLVDAFAAAQAVLSRGVSPVIQAGLADFISEGHLSRHIRRMRVLYKERRTAFVEAAERELGGFVELGPTETGLHTIGWLPAGYDDEIATGRAATSHVEALALSNYALRPLRRGGLILGYAAATPEAIRAGMKRLAEALRYP